MITWAWGVIESAVWVAEDEYDPPELGCCLIVHWDYLCITMYDFVNQSGGKIYIYVKVNNIYLGTATDFYHFTKRKKKSKISMSRNHFRFKTGSTGIKSTRISVRKIYAWVGDYGILFLGEKCFCGENKKTTKKILLMWLWISLEVVREPLLKSTIKRSLQNCKKIVFMTRYKPPVTFGGRGK